ncbi:MAG: hypothetical protein ACRDF5_01550 [bacterium]
MAPAAARDPVRFGIRLGTLISLALAVVFFVTARVSGAPGAAQYGGAVWVFILSLLVSLPLLTPLMRKKSGQRRVPETPEDVR